jgi:hypothetical protein
LYACAQPAQKSLRQVKFAGRCEPRGTRCRAGIIVSGIDRDQRAASILGFDDDMSKQATPARKHESSAGVDDIRRVLGELDETKLLDIQALQPTIRDLEEASLWLSGDPDVFGAEPPIRGVASKIVTILTADEEDEPARAH